MCYTRPSFSEMESAETSESSSKGISEILNPGTRTNCTNIGTGNFPKILSNIISGLENIIEFVNGTKYRIVSLIALPQQGVYGIVRESKSFVV